MEIYLNEVKETDEMSNYFQTISHLASGSFGKVIHAIDLSDNAEIAIKVIEKRKCKKLNAIKKEVLILQQLNHPNIVKFLGFLETDNHLYIKMEHLKGGTLKSFMKRSNLTEFNVSVILKHLFEAVNYLHSREITHRDIKPDNIMLLDTDDLSSLKLIDFGLSSQDLDELFKYDLCGTVIYMAPEQLDNKRGYNKSVDIWSCGIVMYMLLNSGEHPVYNVGLTFSEYISKFKKFEWKSTIKASSMAIGLLDKLLEKDPTKRYTIDKCLKHPWITRNKYDKIPITHMEDWKVIAMRNKFRDLISGVIFLNGYLKILNKEEDLKPKVPAGYDKLLSQISHTIRLKFKRKRDKCFELESDLLSSDEEIYKGIFTTQEAVEAKNISIPYDTKIGTKFKSDKNLFNITNRKSLKIKLETDGTDLRQPKKLLPTKTPQVQTAIRFNFRKQDTDLSSNNSGKIQTTDCSVTQESKLTKPVSLNKNKIQDRFVNRHSAANLNRLDTHEEYKRYNKKSTSEFKLDTLEGRRDSVRKDVQKKHSIMNLKEIVRKESIIANTKFIKINTATKKLNLLNLKDFQLPPIKRNSQKL
jgi:serine/threonine protein kinase